MQRYPSGNSGVVPLLYYAGILGCCPLGVLPTCKHRAEAPCARLLGWHGSRESRTLTSMLHMHLACVGSPPDGGGWWWWWWWWW